MDYQSRPPAARRRANLARAGILIAVVLLSQVVLVLLYHPLFDYSENQWYLGGGIIGTPAAPITYGDVDHFPRLTYSIQASVYLLLLLLTQWLFLRAKGGFRIDRLGGARLTPASAIVAGLIAMLLCIGLLATLTEIPNWWQSITLNDPHQLPPAGYRQKFGAVWIVMFVTWLVWAWVFWIYGRNMDRYTFTGKVLRKLLAGTVLELFIAGVTHAWVVNRRGGECYCTRGSYTGIVFGMTALVWLFGPGLWFIVQREKRRREKLLQDVDGRIEAH